MRQRSPGGWVWQKPPGLCSGPNQAQPPLAAEICRGLDGAQTTDFTSLRVMNAQQDCSWLGLKETKQISRGHPNPVQISCSEVTFVRRGSSAQISNTTGLADLSTCSVWEITQTLWTKTSKTYHSAKTVSHHCERWWMLIIQHKWKHWKLWAWVILGGKWWWVMMSDKCLSVIITYQKRSPIRSSCLWSYLRSEVIINDTYSYVIMRDH